MVALHTRSVPWLLLTWMSSVAIAATPEVLPIEKPLRVESGAIAAPMTSDPPGTETAAPLALDLLPSTTAAAFSVAVDPPMQSDAMLDRAHRGLHSVLWRSAMRIDQWFGADMPETTYQSRAVGSITPAILWDERDGLSQSFKFRVKIPLPHLGQRYQAFIGTFNRDEFVTEREQASGAIPRKRTRNTDDQQETLLGIGYRADEDSNFDADVGIRIRFPLDPFVKGSYRYSLGSASKLRLGLRETVFWQNSEGLGVTSRVDVERLFSNATLLNWAISATISQETEGVRGYTAITSFRPLSNRRAIGAQAFASGEFDAAVPLEDYGIKLSYRQSVWRDWLVLEVRPSATYPRQELEEKRKLNLGIGIGFEIFFGTMDFQARPAMF